MPQYSRPVHMKFVKGRSLATLFNYLTEAFRENELCDLYLRNIVTYFVYPINLSLRNIDTFREFETYKER